MLKSAFDTAAFPAAARKNAWESRLRGFAIDASMAGEEDAFNGHVESYSSPRGLTFSIIESEPQKFSHEPGRREDVVWLSAVLEGSAEIDIDGAPATLEAGDVIYGKRGAPGTLAFSSRFRMLVVNIPGSMISSLVLLPLPARVIRLQCATGLNLVLARMLSAVADSFENLNDTRLCGVETALVDLLVNCIFDGTGEPILGGSATGSAAALERIWRSIEAQLTDPDLSILDLATQHRVSVRSIQLLFEQSGQSFRTFLRRRRLENCRRDIANPLNANVSITTICLHWGFGDSAGFSRAFREEYAMSPTEYRRAMIEGRQTNGRPKLSGLHYRPS